MQAIIASTIFERGTANVIYRRRGVGLYEYNTINVLIFCEQQNPLSLNQQRICVPMQAIIASKIFESGTANVLYRRRGEGGGLYDYNKIILLIFCEQQNPLILKPTGHLRSNASYNCLYNFWTRYFKCYLSQEGRGWKGWGGSVGALWVWYNYCANFLWAGESI